MIIASFDQMNAAAAEIADHVTKKIGIEGVKNLAIVAEPTGGMCLAVKISHVLELIICRAQKAPGTKKGSVFVRQAGIDIAIEHAQPQHILWVNDLIDSGRTLTAARRHLEGLLSAVPPIHKSNLIMAAWFNKTWLDKASYDFLDKPRPSSFFSVDQTEPAKWIVFPWENGHRAKDDEEAYRSKGQ